MSGSSPVGASYHNLYCIDQSVLIVLVAEMSVCVCSEVRSIIKGAVVYWGSLS